MYTYISIKNKKLEKKINFRLWAQADPRIATPAQSRWGLTGIFPAGRRKPARVSAPMLIGRQPGACLALLCGQRNERVREAEWFICHGKTHKERKVILEDWADVRCQLSPGSMVMVLRSRLRREVCQPPGITLMSG